MIALIISCFSPVNILQQHNNIKHLALSSNLHLNVATSGFKMHSSRLSVAPDVGPKLCPPGEVEVNGRCKGEMFAQTFGETTTSNSSTVLNVRYRRLCKQQNLGTHNHALCFTPFSSCHSSSSVSTHHLSGTCGPERPSQVLLYPPAMEPTSGLPRSLGQAHQPQYEGGDPAGIHDEALFSCRDGWCSLQARRNGNSCHDVPRVYSPRSY